MQAVLGLDLGTGGVRAILVNSDGQIIAAASREYPLKTPRPNWAEQNPEDWWEASAAAVRECLAEAGKICRPAALEVSAVGLSGQMHGSVFLDSKGQVLYPALLWCDQRTEEQCAWITTTLGLDNLISLTANQALTGFTAPKILWLRQHEAEIYSRTAKVLLPKDYLRYRMTGVYATEASDASGTLLFDVKKRRWSTEILEALDIPAALMPECYESYQISGRISKAGAEALGLPLGTPVVGGGGDQAAGAVGCGIVTSGLASCALGTSGVVFWHTDEPYVDPLGRLHAFCHAVPGKWHLMGVTLAAGGSLRWYRDALCQAEVQEAAAKGVDPYEIITQQAASAAPGAEGLLFLPYLAGERTPYADAAARGAFLGLSLRHSKSHLVRAVLEGVTMSLKDCLELGRETGVATSAIRLTGGGARSPLWHQLVADIFEVEVTKVAAEEGPAYGAAILAAVGAGYFDTVEEACISWVKTMMPLQPQPSQAEAYRRLYQLYRPLYGTLKDFFHANAAFVNGRE